jgi:hypothetical protein
MPKLHFGWFTPPLGIAESGGVPLAIWQQAHILPVVARHFDSLWLPDHLYAFASTSSPWLECWRWLDHLRPLVELGVTQFILDCGHVSTTDVILRFAEQVIAPLKAT